MIYLFLPGKLGCTLSQYESGAGKDVVAVIPGASLLSENVPSPSSVKNLKDFIAWTKVNPDVCDFNPIKDTIININFSNGHVDFFAVDKELWCYWCEILSTGYDYQLRFIPDWLLLPYSTRERNFASIVNEHVVFRNGDRTGGAFPLMYKHVIEPSQFRWLIFPGNVERGLTISPSFTIKQVEKLSFIPCSRKSGFNQMRIFSILQAISFAALMSLCGEFIVLQHEHSTEHDDVYISNDLYDISPTIQAYKIVHDIQKQGPVSLVMLKLTKQQMEYESKSPLACEKIKNRLVELESEIKYSQLNKFCSIHIIKRL